MDQFGCIDYEGQERALDLMNYSLLASTLLSFFIGFIRHDVWLAVYVFLALSALCLAAIVPPWPYLNQAKETYTWIPSRYQAALKNLQAQLDGEETGKAAK
ncbi:microsomal signal peptidase 12 kDa subunit-domain-containing protein [Protomyces lactucae-debilis]|uniref:Signal peptidase complex subunit 1 n=1 Tax=Protomyces lactucae-debilis TaxID=2754530 RepID=A0A1Y2FQE4_PROLT|nr:microsomal signal peptidase 12 kDa subunit-domain-containing protein [Protomyces lactucae-debilis]ORY85544.1 microsomal signal peptidase 12 kDa subunit-domain-containing protein [Protomyces lactucae-debilis]